MRPGEIYFLLVPPPAAVGAFFAQHEWLAAILVAACLTFLGACIRVLNAFVKDVEHKGGWWSWRREGYEALEAREKSRDTRLRHEEGRRMIKLEGKQHRRDFKRRMSSWADQLSLFHRFPDS